MPEYRVKMWLYPNTLTAAAIRETSKRFTPALEQKWANIHIPDGASVPDTLNDLLFADSNDGGLVDVKLRDDNSGATESITFNPNSWNPGSGGHHESDGFVRVVSTVDENWKFPADERTITMKVRTVRREIQ